MIRINLHDYRYELRKIEIQKRVVKCAAIVVAAVFFIVALWFMEQVRLDSIRSETQKLESQVAGLKGQFQKIKAMETKQKRMKTIIAGIDSLREKQLPAGTIVSDLNMTVPEGIWLTSIIQRDSEYLRTKKVPVIMYGDPVKEKENRRRRDKKNLPKEFVEISGYSLTEEGVAEYMKRIQELPYYKTTFLYQSLRRIIGGQALHKFIIYGYMPEKKKSA